MTKSKALKEIGESLAKIGATLLILGEEMEEEPKAPEAEVKKEEPKTAPEAEVKKEGPKTAPEAEVKKEGPKTAQEAEEKKEEPKAREAEEKKEEPKPQPEKKYTLEDVRKALSAKSGAGFTAEVRALLERHGASKLSGIKESEYAAIMEEVQTIGSAQ